MIEIYIALLTANLTVAGIKFAALLTLALPTRSESSGSGSVADRSPTWSKRASKDSHQRLI